MESRSNFQYEAQFFILFEAEEGRAKGGRTKSKIYIMGFGGYSQKNRYPDLFSSL